MVFKTFSPHVFFNQTTINFLLVRGIPTALQGGYHSLGLVWNVFLNSYSQQTHSIIASDTMTQGLCSLEKNTN